jgi:MoaA/NifB/PqqE/SkfB family radical SAM enzyme
MYKTRILPRIRQQRVLHDVTLELTYDCNLDCFYCYNDRDKPGELLSITQYRQLLQDLARMQTLFLMLTGGEPMLHPHFFEIGATARELGFVTRVRTNGHSLGQRNVARLLQEVEPYLVEVSLHGATAEVHDRQTRVVGSFDRLVKNIAGATAAGLRCSFVTTPTAWNEHQIEDMHALCISLGVPLRFQGPVAPRDNGDVEPLAIQPSANVWTAVERVAAAQKVAATAGLDTHASGVMAAATGTASATVSAITEFGMEAVAPLMQEEAASCSVGVAGVDIDPYGNVQACMHLQRSAGNLHQQSIAQIWNDSPLFLEARNKAVAAAAQFEGRPLQQLGAPLFCLAVEENCNKGCGGNASRSAQASNPQLIPALSLSP